MVCSALTGFVGGIVQSGVMTPEAAVRRVSEEQFGTITRSQVLASGMTEWSIRRQLASGAWSRLEAGVYQVHGAPSALARMAAATVALPAVVSHEAAAELHRLGWVERGRAVVTVPHRMSNRFSGVQIHESTDLAVHHITSVQGLPVTTIPRTLFDLAGGTGVALLRRLVEDAISARKTSSSEIRSVFHDLGRRGRPGTARFRVIVDALEPGFVAPESELERKVIDLLDMAGLPPPTRQLKMTWRTEVDGRVDLAYPDKRLIIECDGRRWHTATEAFERDRRRDNLAQLSGWRVLRFTWTDVTRRALVVVDQVRSALDQSAA